MSEVVNHLLNTTDTPQPFDFAINNQLIRTSLKKFIQLNSLSTEEVIIIEYLPSISISDESNSIEVPAWVGCINTNINDIIIAGCYDGKIQIINNNNCSEKDDENSNLDVIDTINAHDEPIRSITTWRNNEIGNDKMSYYIGTASKDHSVKCWLLNVNQNNSSNCNSKKNGKEGANGFGKDCELTLAASLVVSSGRGCVQIVA